MVITEYAYEMYQEFEYKKTDGTVTPIETMDDLLNKTLGTYSICSSTPLKVVGIIDTKFNYERYEIAKFDEEFGCEYNVEINQIMANGLHNILYFGEGVVDRLKEMHNNQYISSKTRIGVTYGIFN